MHITDCVETLYEVPLLSNYTASATFLETLVAVRSVDWIFINWSPAWRWLGEYVTLDRTFYSLLFKQEVAAAPVISTFSCRFPRWGLIKNIIIILCINNIIIIFNNNVVINNLWKTPRPYFALQNSHERTTWFLRNVQPIWTSALRKFRQPCSTI